MNKKEYYRVVTKLEKELNNGAFKPFLDVVKIFENINTVASNLNFIAFTPTQNKSMQQNQAADNERNKVSQAIASAIKADKASTLFMSFAVNVFQLKEYIADIIKHDGVTKNTSDMLNDYLGLMDSFSSGFENYRKDFSPNLAYSLSFIAKQLLTATDNLNLVISTILDHYRVNDVRDDSKQLEIYLSNIMSLKQFGGKLQALDELHTEICILFDVSLSEYPLVIEHIENGSLLARIAGHPIIISTITAIVTTSANHFIEQYPAQGQFVELKENVETLDQMFSLSEKLKAEGYDVDNMQDDIHKSLIKIAKSTNNLLSDQPVIEVNDKVFGLDEANKVKMLESSQKLLGHTVSQDTI